MPIPRDFVLEQQENNATANVTFAGSGIGSNLVTVGQGNQYESSETANASNCYKFGENVDFTDIELEIQYAKANNNAELYLTRGVPLTRKNLIGDNGYFNVIIKFIKRSMQTIGDSIAYNSAVVGTETYTLNEWIEKATGKRVNANGTAWDATGGTQVGGFYVDYDNGNENGASLDGVMNITFRLNCAVSGASGSKTATISIGVIIEEEWYTDSDGAEIELRPYKINQEVKAAFERGVYTTVALENEYLLVKSSVTDLAIGVVVGELGSFHGTLVRKIDQETGEPHFFIGSYEVYGVMRNAVSGYTAGTVIPQNGEVILFHDYEPAVIGESNIEVKFPCYVEGNADRIDKCRIAKLFGNSNAKNRLFVAGNPDYPNCDWHSSASNDYLIGQSEMETNGDFTYFGDMDYCFYGQTDNAVMGYDNVATDKMVVIKSKSKTEPTNYFRTSSLIQALDASGNALTSVDGSTLYKESFPLATGNIGAGAMNMRSIANLNGDTLYLSSENTICGLDIAGQVGDSQRIAYSRSRYIDPELKELDLSDAFLWSDNSYLCLFTEDAVYVTHYETLNEATNQYEWFKLGIEKARCAIEIDGSIYFGDESGSLYVFEKDAYEDIDKIDVSVGGTLYENDKITYNSAINEKISEHEVLTFKVKKTSDEPLFRKVANIRDVESQGIDLLINHQNNTLKIAASDTDRYNVLSDELAYGGYFYFDKPDGAQSISVSGECDIVVSEPYRIVASDEGFDEYKVLVGDTDTEADLSALIEANLCRALDGEYEITELDKENCTFKISHNGRPIDVILYNNQDMTNLIFRSEIRKHKKVSAKFITAPATLGGVNYRKTIWQWTMTASDKPNDLKVCQATNEESFDKMKQMAFADNIPIGLDFKQITFMSLDFGKSAIPRKYSYFRPISVPFMSFGFKSEEAANSILTSIAITYSTPMLGWGNR